MSIDRPATSRLCLATVTTDSFVPGTLVMLHSFLKYNGWFNGDVVIIHAELAAENRKYLSQIYENVRFLEVGPKLHARVDKVAWEFPDFGPVQARFYSLETFRLRNYDKILFCDSDLLFRGPIHKLFDLPEALIVCGDGPYYLGHSREWRRRPDHPTLNDTSDTRELVPYPNTFNSGFVLVGRTLLTDDHYAGLLNLVDGRTYRQTSKRLADQMILNIYFAGQQHLVSATYNYLLAHRAAIHKREGIGLAEAHVLHYNGPAKPWWPDQVLHASQGDPAFIKACEFWFDGYLACLPQLHVKSAGQGGV